MTAIVSTPAPSAQRFSSQKRMERLASVDASRMFEALTFLIRFDPQTFDTILDSVEPVDDEVFDAGHDPLLAWRTTQMTGTSE